MWSEGKKIEWFKSVSASRRKSRKRRKRDSKVFKRGTERGGGGREGVKMQGKNED